jgi:hypothetical protein
MAEVVKLSSGCETLSTVCLVCIVRTISFSIATLRAVCNLWSVLYAGTFIQDLIKEPFAVA